MCCDFSAVYHLENFFIVQNYHFRERNKSVPQGLIYLQVAQLFCLLRIQIGYS